MFQICQIFSDVFLSGVYLHPSITLICLEPLHLCSDRMLLSSWKMTCQLDLNSFVTCNKFSSRIALCLALFIFPLTLTIPAEWKIPKSRMFPRENRVFSEVGVSSPPYIVFMTTKQILVSSDLRTFFYIFVVFPTKFYADFKYYFHLTMGFFSPLLHYATFVKCTTNSCP